MHLFSLEKTVDDGNHLYKSTRYEEASDSYTKALRHIGESVNPKQMQNEDPNNLPIQEFREICSVLLLGLARCSRKLKNLELGKLFESCNINLCLINCFQLNMLHQELCSYFLDGMKHCMFEHE